MKNLFLIFLMCICTLTYAQKPLLDSASLAKKPVFNSLEDALKTPLEVYKLNLFEQKSNILLTEIGKCINLQNLYIAYSDSLTSLPKEIGNLKNLEVLHLRWCKNFTFLPKEIGNLKNLRELYLNDSQFTSLPKEIGNLKNLEILYLNDCNNLTSLPKEIGNLTNLAQLYLEDCMKIVRIPEEIVKLKKLKILCLSSTPISEKEKNKLKKMLPKCLIITE